MQFDKMKRSQKVSYSSLRGHLALNSSALKPTINKLQSQHLIQDQMSSHYYNMATIKPAIDSKPPNSTRKSIKKQDQMRRSNMIKQIQTGSTEFKNQTFPEQRTQRSSFGATGTLGRTSRPATAKSLQSSRQLGGFNQTMRPGSAGATFRVTGTGKQQQRGTMKPSARDVTYSGDYLQRHSERFVDPGDRSFVPRTKKREARSFLSQSRHYAPPVHRRPPAPKKVEEEEKEAESSSSGSDADNDDAICRMKSQHIENRREEDHDEWVKKQAEFVRGLKLADRDDFDSDAFEKEAPRKPNRKEESANDAFAKAMKREPFRDYDNEEKLVATRRKIVAEEEELKYLAFVNKVTNDILSRGIYSNKVLLQTMERHMAAHAHELDEDKMRGLVIELQQNLGIVDTQRPTTEDHYNNTTSSTQPNHLDNNNTTPPQQPSTPHPTSGADYDVSHDDSVATAQQHVDEVRHDEKAAAVSTSTSPSRKASSSEEDYESVTALATVMRAADEKQQEEDEDDDEYSDDFSDDDDDF